jgi:hypothetical protein
VEGIGEWDQKKVEMKVRHLDQSTVRMLGQSKDSMREMMKERSSETHLDRPTEVYWEQQKDPQREMLWD